MSTNHKVEYVLAEAKSPHSGHECHWPGCKKQVAPAMWGCSKHWFTLPHPIRNAIWANFEIGQEKSKKPSEKYIAAAKAAQDWIRKYEATNKLKVKS